MTTKLSDTVSTRWPGYDSFPAGAGSGCRDNRARRLAQPSGASELAASGRGGVGVNMIASDGPAALDMVARGEMQLAISNPAMYLAMAVRGTGP